MGRPLEKERNGAAQYSVEKDKSQKSEGGAAFFEIENQARLPPVRAFHFSALYHVRGKNTPRSAEVMLRARFAAKTPQRILLTPRAE
jgi:hypothetical protein